MPVLLLLLASVFALLFPVTFKCSPPKIPKNKKDFYKQYIQSSEWQRKRKERIEMDKGRCKMFHLLPERKGLQVHHRSYKRLGNESMKDLITLCEYHHKKEHKK